MNILPARNQHLFIVRIWSEEARPTAHWRGAVEYVQSHERMYFTSLADLSDFIGFHLLSGPPPLDAGVVEEDDTL